MPSSHVICKLLQISISHAVCTCVLHALQRGNTMLNKNTHVCADIRQLHTRSLSNSRSFSDKSWQVIMNVRRTPLYSYVPVKTHCTHSISQHSCHLSWVKHHQEDALRSSSHMPSDYRGWQRTLKLLRAADHCGAAVALSRGHARGSPTRKHPAFHHTELYEEHGH